MSRRAGPERGRLGERLRAGLAGLRELELLRAAQRGAVRGALGQRDSPLDLPPGKLPRSRSEDLLGEPVEPELLLPGGTETVTVETVTVESITSRTTVTMETVTPGTTAPGGVPAEPDSRPSSGFYELGSLSDSCPSVRSEGPGSPSRPRSADEAAVRLLRLRRPAADGPAARRPVSTGDLQSPASLADARSPPYERDLVSRSTSEIYRYPSPLHAVALQSPLFVSPPRCQGRAEPAAAPAAPRRVPALSEERCRAQLDRYIAALVLRYKCRVAGGRPEPGRLSGQQKSRSLSSVCGSLPGAGPLAGWKIRRRISTCSHLRSLEYPEGARDPAGLELPGGRSSAASSVGSIPSGEDVAASLPEPLSLPALPPPAREQPEGPVAAPGLEAPPRKGVGADRERLYRGKHASRELVKASEGAENSWLSPRGLFRRITLRRQPAARGTRCSSEMNVCAAAPGPEVPGRHKWASVLEISGRSTRREDAEPGPALLSRHLAFSTDSCFPGETEAGHRPVGRTLPPRCAVPLGPGTSRMRRARSFKELKRMVSRPFRPSALRGGTK
ncbi:dapper homolog 2-like [Struthio camelus]|uniref:dapper homolog 2-like n=1 Tax=Struthio camelus TaxID=8801 RepID=UPI003603ECB1